VTEKRGRQKEEEGKKRKEEGEERVNVFVRRMHGMFVSFTRTCGQTYRHTYIHADRRTDIQTYTHTYICCV